VLRHFTLTTKKSNHNSKRFQGLFSTNDDTAGSMVKQSGVIALSSGINKSDKYIVVANMLKDFLTEEFRIVNGS